MNVRSADPALPEEFRGYYDPERYRTSQEYLRDNTKLDLVEGGVSLAVLVVFIFAGGFGAVDRVARGAGMGMIPTGLIFGGLLLLAFQILRVPFSAWRTFVIEEKYGFNRTGPGTFAADRVKAFALAAVLGGLVFSAVLWFFDRTGRWAWLYAWGAVVAIQLFAVFLAPVVIMPLFNRFRPLAEGELRDKLERYAREERFRMQGLYTMDGSRRSTKANAYFTGLGRFRRIVLFDTLVRRHTPDELVSVLAHEMGHYRLHHIFKGIALSVAATGLMFFLLSFFIRSEGLVRAFGVEQASLYAGFVFFGFLYVPVSTVVSVAGNSLSRRYEYEADAYAVRTYRQPAALIEALKKLSVDNLSNLTPHPLMVFLEYTHPPVLKRIRAIRSMGSSSGE